MQKLIGAGEKTGKLGLVLNSLKDLLRIRMRMQQELRQATQMPLITLVIACVLIGGIFIFILPHFEGLYTSLNCSLPAATQMALSISRKLHSVPAAIIGLSVLLIIPLANRYARSFPRFNYGIDTISMQLPLISKLLIYKELIIFSTVIEIFLRSGLPLAEALDHAIDASSNTLFKKTLQEALNELLHGQSLSSALQLHPSPFIDEQLIALIHIGEQSGTLDALMYKAGIMYQEKLNATLHTITALATPLLTIFIGLLIGGLMITIYLPIFKLGSLFNP
ncbi:unnamed protein product [Sphagnum tenellum]